MSETNSKKSLSDKMGETRHELKRVQWPSKSQLVKYTIITLITVIFFAVLIYLIDSVLGFAITKFVSSAS